MGRQAWKTTILLVEEDEDQVTFAMRALRKQGIVDEEDLLRSRTPAPHRIALYASEHSGITGAEKCEAALAADRDSFEMLPTTREALDVGYSERDGPYVGDWQNRW